MLFVSHDRAFLRGLSNRVLELGGESGTEREPHSTRDRTWSTSRAPATKRRVCTADDRASGEAGTSSSQHLYFFDRYRRLADYHRKQAT